MTWLAVSIHCNLFAFSVSVFIFFYFFTLPEKSLADISNDGLGGHLVTTSAGIVHGVWKSTLWGNVVKYYGIPYAEPTSRFKPSIPLLGQDFSLHTKTKPALYENHSPPSACVQQKHLPDFSHPSIPHGGLRVSEDCLMLNVFQPADLKPSDRIPMVLFVPGDGYSFSDSAQYDGSALAVKGKVIVVVLNYRVGVFGFASMGNTTLSGNAGLTDIISALKFLIHNAAAFYGDSENITLAGRYTGAMAISTLITSPLFYRSNGNKDPLSKRVILHGGAATSEYSVDPNPLEKFEKLVSATSCNKDNAEETLLCLQSFDALKLLEKASQISYSWRPAIDGVNIPRNPIESIEFGHFSSEITFLIGDNSDSGSICYNTQKFLQSSYLSEFKTDTFVEDSFDFLALQNIKEFYQVDEPNLIGLTSHEYHYHMSPNILTSWRNSYLRFCGALYIRTPVELLARYASRLNAVVYRYEFAYKASTSTNPEFLTGALGEEIIFGFPTENTEMNQQDMQLFDTFIVSWANFIKTGNPSTSQQKWETFNEIDKNLIGFTENGIEVSTSNLLDSDVHFWRQVFLPLVKLMSNQTNCSNNTSTSTAYISNSGRMGFLSVFFLTVICAGILVFLVHIIRKWQKRYVSTYKS